LTAGQLLTAEQAERRVIVLENPAFKGKAQITTSLYAGVQMILPGEVARTHRHTASALRLILQGAGGYTVVNGEKVSMHRGDFIVTPSWSAHDHGSEGSEPVIWLDGLDVPIVNLLNAGFAEDVGNGRQAPVRSSEDSVWRYGSGLVPVGHASNSSECAMFWYPYSRTREALVAIASSGECDECEGIRSAFTNPTTGASPIRTMGAFMQLLPAGFAGTPLRSTDGAVYAVVEGHGRVTVGGDIWDVGPSDIFVVPGWTWHRFDAQDRMIVFSFSDRPLQQQLGVWREERSCS
jgi:gentisate 1,2-dioxygenase